MIDSPNNSGIFNNTNSNNTFQEINNLDIENIYNNRDHYLCAQCLKFPYIKFCKDRKQVRLTCSCFNNKKILIKDLIENNILFIKSNSNTNFLSTSNLNLNDDIEDELKCKKHHAKFEGFSKIFLNNHCQSCINEHQDKIEDKIIKFDDIKIEDIKIKQLLNIINNNNISFEESNIKNSYIIIDKNNGICEKLSKEEEYYFNK